MPFVNDTDVDLVSVAANESWMPDVRSASSGTVIIVVYGIMAILTLYRHSV